MNSTLKIVFAAAAVLVAGTACGPAAVAPSSAVPALVASPSTVVSPSAVASASPQPNPSQQAARLTVGGTELSGSTLQLTVELPQGWQGFQWGAQRGTSSPPAGMAFIVSLVDNTFEDPCSHSQRSPKVGPTVDDLATALGQIPNTTATHPVQTTIAGYQATYIEIAIPASLPCDPSEFYMWQDSPDGDWWVQGLNETARVWILEVGSRRIAFLAHAYPGSGADPKAEFEKILNSIVFDSASSPNPSPSLDTSAWVVYTSARYALSIKHPADWHVDPSDHTWTLAKDSPSFESSALESFTGVDPVLGDVRVSAWSVAIKPGSTLEEWIASYCPKNASPCTKIQDRAMPVYAESTMDRHPGLLVPFGDDAYAFFQNGDRIWVVAVWRPESDPSVAKYGGARRLLEAFAGSMCLGCGAPASTASPSP